MDMTTALDYNENYADPESDIWLNKIAGNQSKLISATVIVDFFLQGVEQDGEHGEKFVYKSINTDVLAWVIARASGKDFIEHLSEKIWQTRGRARSHDGR